MKQKETLAYIIAWAVVFAAGALYILLRSLFGAQPFRFAEVLYCWETILPFLVLFLLHELVAFPFFRRGSKAWYIVLTVLFICLFALWCFTLGRHAPEMPHGFAPGPPPEFGPAGGPADGFTGGPAGGGPGMPPPPGGPGVPGKYGPEFTKILIALMMILVDLGLKANRYAIESKRKMNGLESDLKKASVSVPDLVFKTARKTVTVPTDKILYIESMSEYIKIYLDGDSDPVVILYSLKKLMQELPEGRFIRIHRSYIVAADRIRETIPSSVVLDGGVRLPVGETYRSTLKTWSSRT